MVQSRVLQPAQAAPGATPKQGITMTSPTHSHRSMTHFVESGNYAPPSDLPNPRLRQHHRPATALRRALNAPPRRQRDRPPTPHPLRRSVGPPIETGPSRPALVHTLRQPRRPHPRPCHPRNERRWPHGAVPAVQLEKGRPGPCIPKCGESALTVADPFLRGVIPDPQLPKRSIYRRSFRSPGVVRW